MADEVKQSIKEQVNNLIIGSEEFRLRRIEEAINILDIKVKSVFDHFNNIISEGKSND